MVKTRKRAWLLVIFALLAAMLFLCACAASQNQSDSSEPPQSSEAAAPPQNAEETRNAETDENEPAEEEEKPYGSPWANSMAIGNLPEEKPDAVDDIYASYDYDFLASHQDKGASYMNTDAERLEDALMEMIADDSKTGHDLEQLQIFYNQALDSETLDKIGFSEVAPYIDMLKQASSIEELNEVLSSNDFPFDTYLDMTLTVTDKRKDTVVDILPKFLLFDALYYGGEYYRNSDDADIQTEHEHALESAALGELRDVSLLGLPEECYDTLFYDVIDFEKAYGQYAESPYEYMGMEFGSLTDAMAENIYTLDELCALAPNVPIRGMIAKDGKDGSRCYVVTGSAWLKALNGQWTDDNLELLKVMTELKVLSETRPYRASVFDDLTATSIVKDENGNGFADSRYGSEEETDAEDDEEQMTLTERLYEIYADFPDSSANPEEFAYGACDKIDTFAQVMAKLYEEEVLGESAKERFCEMCEEIIGVYKENISETPWLDDESAALVEEKLDNMTLNILEPASGYFDYSDLELVPTEDGGTLMSNYLKLKRHRLECESELIGKKATGDTVWWAANPTAMNAYYEQYTNSINILPGYITSSMYRKDMSDSELLATIGWTVGHEISHAFDYAGAQMDAFGTPRAVFSEKSTEAFVKKADQLAAYYHTMEYMPGKYLNGTTQVGEAAADLCSAQVCLELTAKYPKYDCAEFIEKAAMFWARTIDKDQLTFCAIDAHPLGYLRINVSMQMFEAVYDELGIEEGDGMYLAPEKRIVIWGKDG